MLFIAGLAVGFFVGLLTPFIAYAAFGGDRTDNARDEHTEILGIGGGEILAHAQPTTNRERNDHA